jgi:hypothetical protein
VKKNMGVLGMKSMASGHILQSKTVSPLARETVSSSHSRPRSYSIQRARIPNGLATIHRCEMTIGKIVVVIESGRVRADWLRRLVSRASGAQDQPRGLYSYSARKAIRVSIYALCCMG